MEVFISRFLVVFVLLLAGILCSAGEEAEAAHRGAFEMDKDIPVDLACPEVPGYGGKGARPIKVERIRFTEAACNLRSLVEIEGATSATAAFAVRVKIFTDRGISVLLAEREFIFKTLLVIARGPMLIAEQKQLDFGPIQQFATANSFEVEIEDISRGPVPSSAPTSPASPT